MLVLDRKNSEGFWIDGRVFVKVLAVGRRRVKLGIEAPGGMRIVREELEPSAFRNGPEVGGVSLSVDEEQAGGSFRPVRG